MNHIYKVIWSRVKHCYVVVSEIATNGGKSRTVSEKKNASFGTILCAFALVGCLMPGVVEATTVHGPGAAATGSGSTAVGDNTKAVGSNSVAVGPLTTSNGVNSTAVGYDAKTDATAENSVAIGRGAHAGGQKRTINPVDPYTASTIAIGNVAYAAENGDIVIGRQATSSMSKYHDANGSGAVVMGAEAHSYGSRGDVVIGSGAEASIIRKGVTNPDDNPKYSQGTAIGSNARVYGTQAIGIGADVRSIGHSSIAIGGDDIDAAKPDLNVAVPDMALPGSQKNFNRELASLYPGTTLGSGAPNNSKNYVNTASIGHGSIAIGMMTQSLGTGSTAIGVNSLTKGVASTGIGVMARSWGKNSLAVGSQVGAYGDKAISIGDTNTVGFDMTDGATSGTKSAALGVENKVYGSNSYAIGDGNTIGSATITETTETNDDKIKKVTAGTVKGNTAGAFGNKNTITTDNAYAVGNNSTASADGAMILGSTASVTGKNGVALGNNTKVANENAVAIGNGSETAVAVATQSATINGEAHNFAGVNPTSTVSVGKAGAERTITNVAAGRISATSTDAINGSQLYAMTTEIDKGVVYAGDVKAAAAPDNKFTQKLGAQTNIVGGVTDESKLSDNNIGVVSNGTDTLNVKLAKDLNVDSVTTGTTVINNNGLTVGGKSFITPNGINANNAPITNVADGNVAPNSKDAVNGGQLNEVKALAGKHTIVKVDGQENRTDGNLLITKTDNNGQATYDLKLNDNLAIGKEGPTGKDGSIGVKGKDGSGVAINGKDGSIDLNGANGANGLTMKSGDAKPAVDGTGITRLVLEENGVKHDVATLDDGLQFTGNNENTVNKHKLNTLVKVQGEGVTQADSDNFASASGNINVKANGTDKLELQLAKNLKNLDSVTAAKTVKAGDAVMGGQTVTNAGGDNETGNYVTGLDNKTWNPDKIVSGRAATEDQVKDAIAAQTATGLKFDANVGGVKTNKLGSTVLVKGEGTAADNDYSGENIKTFITQDNDGNTTINVKMNRSLLADSIKVNKKGKDAKDGVTLTGPDGANGTDGKVGISGKDGNDAVSMSGKDGIGHIGLNGKDGRNADMIVDKGTPDLDGNEITRIKYTDENGTPHEVATKDDGMMYGGDSGTVIKKKLNSQVNVKGGITDENLLTDEDNIGVVSDGNDTLKLRLAKDLQGLKSATFKNGNVNTVINGDGMTITETTPDGNNSVSLTKDGLNNGGKKITNVAEGTDPNDAVNVNQLKKATDAATTTVTAGNNITVTPTTNPNGSTNYEVGLKDQVTLGSDPTKQIAFDGTTGTIKAGDKVTIEGNKGNITAGKVAIDGENGIIKAGDKVTIDGKDGKIDAGKIAVNGKDGYVTGLENKTFDPANIVSGRAATEDQLKASHDSLDQKITNMGDEITKKGMDFAGNTGEFHRDLGQKVTIKGEGTEADDKYSGENIKTVADNNGNITIKMAKDIKADSVTANTVNGGTVNADKVKVGKSGPDGVTITGPNGADGTDGKVGVSGKNGKDAVSMSGKDGVGHIGLTGKDGRNADITAEKGDEDLNGNEITRMKYIDENGTPHQVATKDDGMKYGGDSGAVIKKKFNEQVNVVGGISDVSKLSSEDNLGVVSDGTGNLKIRMAKDLKGLESVTTKDAAGNTTVVNGGGMTITPSTGNSVSLTKDGLNNGGNRITNIGPGVNGTDAVNMNQLNGLMGDMEGQIADSGAASAAISGLKPLQYDPLEPTQVMAALGHYKGSTAAALGVAHYTNESTLFHMGVSLGGHDNMFNAGVSYKFGTSDAKKAVPERYKGGPISSAYVMQDEVTALKAKYEKVQRDNEEMKAQIAFLMQQLGNK